MGGNLTEVVVAGMTRTAVNGPRDRKWQALVELAHSADEVAPFAQFLIGECNFTRVETLLTKSVSYLTAQLDREIGYTSLLHFSDLRFEDIERLGHLARLGSGFPDSSTWPTLARLRRSYGDLATAKFAGLLWISSGQFDRLLAGEPPPRFEDTLPTGSNPHGGATLMYGLINVLKHKWRTVNPKVTGSFLVNLTRWCSALGVATHEVKEVPEVLRYPWWNAPIDEIEMLSSGWFRAIHELARRHKPLPEENRTNWTERTWVSAYITALSAAIPRTLTIEQGVSQWREAASGLERRVLETRFEDSVMDDPTSPFRPQIRSFLHLVGISQPSPDPSYDSCLAHLKANS